MIDQIRNLTERVKADNKALPLVLKDDWYLYDDQLSIIDTLTPCEGNKLMVDIRNLAPKMLKILSLFKKGDSKILKCIENDLNYYSKRLNGWKSDNKAMGAIEEENVLHRLQKAASLIEDTSEEEGENIYPFTWRKIGEEEEDAIGFAIEALEQVEWDSSESINTLKKLLEQKS